MYADAEATAHWLLILEQNVFWFQVPVADAFGVHVTESIEHLPGNVFDLFHRNRHFHFSRQFELLLEITLAELHDEVLDESLLCVKRVEKVDELHRVGRSFQLTHDVVLARDYIADLKRSLHSDSHVTVLVEGLEDIPYP